MIQIENCKLYQGNCLELMKEIPEKSIDMILCDLPYGTTACKWDNIIPFDKLWDQYKRVRKDNAAIVLFGSEPFSSYLRMSNIKEYKYDWIWNKKTHSSPLLAKKQPLRVYENIIVFYKEQPRYNPQMKKGNPYNKNYGYDKHTYEGTGDTILFDITNTTGLRYPLNILEIPLNKNNRDVSHPTQKPVALMEYLIRTYTNENMVVLDNCMGSGSTGVACINTKRKFIGMELEEKYFNIAVERIKKENQQLNLGL